MIEINKRSHENYFFSKSFEIIKKQDHMKGIHFQKGMKFLKRKAVQGHVKPKLFIYKKEWN